MKKLDATPFPANAVSHEVPFTALERRILQISLAQFAGKKIDEVRDRAEVFNAIGPGATPTSDWEQDRRKELELAHFDDIVRVKVTKKMIRTIRGMYEEVLTMINPNTGGSFLAGTQSFAFGELVDRLAWVHEGEK